jgi:4-diphosphocytidyl-2-C-methyl-D-erythritol kinase
LSDTKQSLGERSVRVGAPGKVNLYLEVIGKRPDGFHDLETIFQTIELHDVVDVTVGASGAAAIALACDDPSVPADDRNLAWRAAAAYRRARPALGNVAVTLAKRIPHGAGLGGGSSDAAAVLRALQKLAPEPLAPPELASIALEIGSDVPFFLVGGTAHASGRGEVLTPLPDLGELPLTIVQPPVECATPAVFRALTAEERGPRPLRGAASWHEGADPAGWLFNRLTDAAVRVAPAVGEVLAWLAGRATAHVMTGSGSACLALGEVPVPPAPWRCWRTTMRTRARLDAIA